MPEDPNIHPYWAADTKELARRLDELDYFEVLGVEANASLEDIKAQYHSLQRAYHPDTFYQSPDTDLRGAVFKISKRVAEAYVILRDRDKRTKYSKDISGPDRAKKLRFSEEAEQEIKKEKEAELGRTAQGRNLVTKAQAAMKKGDYANAERDLKTALLFEKGNKGIEALLAEVQTAKGGKK